jgi:hypothetical protein
MGNVIFYATFALTICFVCALFVQARLAMKRGGTRRKLANRFFFAAAAAGVVAGLPMFIGVLSLLDALGRHVAIGHGEILIAVPLWNAILALVLATIGRVILVWEPIR